LGLFTPKEDQKMSEKTLTELADANMNKMLADLVALWKMAERWADDKAAPHLYRAAAEIQQVLGKRLIDAAVAEYERLAATGDNP
jgi:hypothetical protein